MYFQQQLKTLALLGALTLSSAVFAQESEEQTNKKLTSIQQEIAQQKLAISSGNKKRDAIEAQLRKDDIAISRVTKAINKTSSALMTTANKLVELKKEKTKLTKEKQQQEKVLAKQLRAAYSNGHHDYLKLLLNQEKTTEVQRTLTYYQYLNEARIEEIEKFQQTLAALQQVTIEQEQEEQSLLALKQTQAEQKQKLQQTKKERSATITALNKELLSTQQQLKKLQAEEDNLVLALERLAAASRAELSLSGLAKLKNKLKWPVKGKITRNFGSQKQGYLKWKGVLLRAPVGRQVVSIHQGKVLFSDWLKGYGLVTVIDHGEGYMSLYGHNQTLLKSVGDRVESGEPIALAGQSGGQENSGLYFEIRYKGKAVNPRRWCK